MNNFTNHIRGGDVIMSEGIIIQGHVLDILLEFEDGFFDCVITSPPY